MLASVVLPLPGAPLPPDLGAPGSGKTTDASIIAQHDEKFAHFSTGDLLRAEVASGSELGKLIDGFISKGNF